jgi:hypothetical protein
MRDRKPVDPLPTPAYKTDMISVYEQYLQVLDDLGAYRERYGVDDPGEEQYVERGVVLYEQLSPDEQAQSRIDGWRAWPDLRRKRRNSDALADKDELE